MRRRSATSIFEAISARYLGAVASGTGTCGDSGTADRLVPRARRSAVPLHDYDRQNPARHRKLRRSGAEQRTALLSAWLHDLIAAGGERIVAFDTDTATRASEMSDLARSRGHHPGFPDIAIAAIGAALSMAILTLNVRHFEPIGVDVSDPSAEGFTSAG